MKRINHIEDAERKLADARLAIDDAIALSNATHRDYLISARKDIVAAQQKLKQAK